MAHVRLGGRVYSAVSCGGDGKHSPLERKTHIMTKECPVHSHSYSCRNKSVC